MAEPLSAASRRDRVRAAARRPVHRHAARRLRRRRDQGRGAGRPATRCATGAACATTTTRLWWSILARNKRSVALNLREPEGQRIAAELRRDRRHRARELPPRHDGEVGARARGRPRAQPARDLRARLRLRPDRPLRAPPGLRLRRRGDLRPALHQRLPRPGAAALGHLPRRHARRAVRLPGHPARALRARERARTGQVVDAEHRRRVLRDDGVDRRSSTRRPASSASRPARGSRASRRATSTAPRTASGS